MVPRRRTLGAALAATIIEAFGGDGVVNGTQANRGRVVASLDRGREPQGLLQTLDLADDVLTHEGDHGTSGPGAAGATGTVEVVGCLRRRIVVDDDWERFDVKSARRDVSRDEDPDLTVLDAAQCALALGLRAVTVQGDGADAALFELAGKAVGAVLGAGEDEGAVVLLDNVGGVLGTLLARDAPEVVVNVARGFVADDVVNGGLVRELLDE